MFINIRLILSEPIPAVKHLKEEKLFLTPRDDQCYNLLTELLWIKYVKRFSTTGFPTVMRQKKGHSGFSLIELLIVIGLLGVMVFLGMPYYRSMLNYASLKNDAWRILSDLRSYRQQAIIEHKNYHFVFDTAAESYQIREHAAGTDAYIQIVSSVSLENNLIQASDTAFRPTGDASSAAIIIVQGKGFSETITLQVYPTTGLAVMSGS